MPYDIIIIGGGSAGCALAARLSENPNRSVLLLEAGPDYPDFAQLPDELKYGYNNDASETDSPYNWAYTAAGSPHQARPMDIARGKVIGGSGSVNGQVFLRGLPEDYDNWAAQTDPQWSYLNVLPYFRQLETDLDLGADDFHGNHGPIPVRRLPPHQWLPVCQAFHQAALDAGFPHDPDMNHPETTGAGAVPMNNPNNIRMSAALAYLNPARHRLNLTVRGNAPARRILFDTANPNQPRATGVEVQSNGQTQTVAGNEIVLCAGAIASPQLLMLSGIGPAHHLRDLGIPLILNLPGVGQNLRDHPMALVELEPAPGVALAQDAPRIQTGLRYSIDQRNDMQITLTSYAGTGGGDPIAGAARRRNGRTLHFTVILEQAQSSGQLTLQSPDPNHKPLINYRYLEHEADLRRMRHGIRLCAQLIRHPHLSPMITRLLSPTETDLQSDQTLNHWLHQNIATTFHTCGSCKMGPPTDPTSVVNPHCQVHGIPNLRIIDLSIAPDTVRANTNATAIMIAERAAPWFN